LWVATANKHKLREIAQILGSGWMVRGRQSRAKETGRTFEQNAAIKANALRNFLARHRRTAAADAVLADDSGLEVAALGGAPGVRSARYAGVGAGDALNRRKLLRALEKITNRRAAFRCVLALAPVSGRGRLHFFRGAAPGRISREERGRRGFGYDSLFVPSGFKRTFAEMSAATKNRLSHRAQALSKMRKWLGRKGAIRGLRVDFFR
jgi:XTP/dITP diphosphohydrolase